MARMTAKTARRSVDDLLKRLPHDSVVEMVKTGQVPADGAAMSIRIEVAVLPDELTADDKTQRGPKRGQK